MCSLENIADALSPFTKKTVCLWSGAIVDIPDGWALCDGNNDLPDLRNRFIVGAGDTYAPGDSGGATPHNHTFTASQHSHNVVAGADLEDNAPFGVNHFITSFTIAVGTTDNTPNLPPYYSLAFIGKI